jgi:CRP-like cAMP-binding protein
MPEFSRRMEDARKSAQSAPRIIMSALIRKMESFVPLMEAEKIALTDAPLNVRKLAAHQSVINEGDQSDGVSLFLKGFGSRYKLLADGRRQIIAYFVPGDLCELRGVVLKYMDHSIETLTAATVATIPQETVLDLAARFPNIGRALWWSTLVEESITREWLVNVGQRTAFERLAHLFCEIFFRLRCVGLTTTDSCELPMTQLVLAETLALSPVHINRTLQELRQEGLVSVRDKTLTIHDLPGLQSAALFSPDYLHLKRQRED